MEKFVEIQRGKNISNVVDILQEDAFKKYNINKIDDFNTETKPVKVSEPGPEISESKNIIIETDMEGDDFMALFIILPKLLELKKLKKITFIIGESNPGKINQKRIIFQDFLKRTYKYIYNDEKYDKFINKVGNEISIIILNGTGGNKKEIDDNKKEPYKEYPIEITNEEQSKPSKSDKNLILLFFKNLVKSCS